MRSQITPPVLCFLIAILFCFSPIIATEKAVVFESKVTENKTFKKNTSNTFVYNLLSTNQAKIEAPELNSDAVLNPGSSKSDSAEMSGIENNSNKDEAEVALGSILPLDITNIDMFSARSLFQNGVFYGFALMVIVLNLVCFFLFEERIFLFYSATLTALALTFLFNDSLFSLFGIGEIENIAAMESSLLLLVTITYAYFASSFLTLEEVFPNIKWTTISLIGFAFIMTFLGWTTESQLLTSIANTTLISVSAIYFSAGIVLFSKKNYVKFYVIASSIPLLFALDFFVLRKLGIEFLLTNSSHLKIATIVEMLIITYAIIYRMRAIKEEHLLRQTEMRLFLKRQEVLNRTNTEKIMQDIYLENLIMQYDLDGFEIKLLQYISEGKDNIKIARKLRTTELEIELCTKELYNKLEIGDHVQDDYRMVDTQPDYLYN